MPHRYLQNKTEVSYQVSRKAPPHGWPGNSSMARCIERHNPPLAPHHQRQPQPQLLSHRYSPIPGSNPSNRVPTKESAFGVRVPQNPQNIEAKQTCRAHLVVGEHLRRYNGEEGLVLQELLLLLGLARFFLRSPWVQEPPVQRHHLALKTKPGENKY